MKVSASGFVSFLTASGRTKVAAVAKCREPYRPEIDFYRRFRQPLDKCLERGSLNSMPNPLSLSPNGTKQQHFSVLMSNIEAYFEEEQVQLLPFSKRYWSAGNLDVSVTSTGRMTHKKKPTIFMTWLKATEPSRNEVDYFSSILSLAYRGSYPKDGFGILDIRRRALLSASSDDWMEQYLFAECAAFRTIWDALEQAA